MELLGDRKTINKDEYKLTNESSHKLVITPVSKEFLRSFKI